MMEWVWLVEVKPGDLVSESAGQAGRQKCRQTCRQAGKLADRQVGR